MEGHSPPDGLLVKSFGIFAILNSDAFSDEFSSKLVNNFFYHEIAVWR